MGEEGHFRYLSFGQQEYTSMSVRLLNHVSKMEDVIYPKQLIEYRPIETRSGRPLNRYQTDTIVRPKQLIYWSDFVTRRRRRRRRRML